MSDLDFPTAAGCNLHGSSYTFGCPGCDVQLAESNLPGRIGAALVRALNWRKPLSPHKEKERSA